MATDVARAMPGRLQPNKEVGRTKIDNLRRTFALLSAGHDRLFAFSGMAIVALVVVASGSIKALDSRYRILRLSGCGGSRTSRDSLAAPPPWMYPGGADRVCLILLGIDLVKLSDQKARMRDASIVRFANSGDVAISVLDRMQSNTTKRDGVTSLLHVR